MIWYQPIAPSAAVAATAYVQKQMLIGVGS